MEENKDLLNTPADDAQEMTEVETVAAAENETEKAVETAPSAENSLDGVKKGKKPAKDKKLKNEAYLKRGGISLAITAVFLAALIILNVLVSSLSKRFNLTFDMTSDKVNTISEDNIKFIKDVEDKVEITVFATEENYVDYISYYSESYYKTDANSDYFTQTLNLVKKYSDYNKNITVNFIDPQSTEFTAFSSNYSTIEFIPGDMLVSSTRDGNERHKKIGFADIYDLNDASGYASQGYGNYTISGNSIETALTSAVAYVTSNELKKVALITGHSAKNYSSKLVELMEDNNFEVEVISDTVVKSIPDEYDAAVIMAPSVDFMGEELDAISAFLDNDGKMGKGLMFFGEASNPALPNLSEFLVEWGIEIRDGILYETDANNRTPDDPCTMYMYALSTDETDNMSGCIVGYNIPITTVTPADEAISVTEYMMTTKTVVAAPVGVSNGWSDYSDSDKAQYAGVVQATKVGADADGKDVQSVVIAFSSVEYIQSEWAEYPQLSNKDITLACSDIAVGTTEKKIDFISKTITNTSFTDAVSEGKARAIRLIFMILLPIAMVGLGIYIYIRRKNA